MRLMVGVDSDGHQYAVDVSTFAKLRAYVLEKVPDEHRHEVVNAATEDDLIDLIQDADWAHDADLGWGRDMFTELHVPQEVKVTVLNSTALSDATITQEPGAPDFRPDGENALHQLMAKFKIKHIIAALPVFKFSFWEQP